MKWASWRACSLAGLGLLVLISLDVRGAHALALQAADPLAAVTPIAVAADAASPTALRPTGLLTVRSLRVAGTANEGSRMFLGPKGASYSIGTDATGGTFAIQQENASSGAPEAVLSLDAKDEVHIGGQRVKAHSVESARGVSVRGVQQWMLVSQEDFTTPQQGTGWSKTGVSHCGGVYMLGGYCKFSQGEVNKVFTGLPPHKQLRIVGTYHFIDRWIGETGYMKLDIGQDDMPPVVVWSEQHSQSMSKNGMNLCGQESTPEGKFSAAVDMSIEHTKDSIQLTFGSTMEDSDPCDESWGVSGIEIYARN